MTVPGAGRFAHPHLASDGALEKGRDVTRQSRFDLGEVTGSDGLAKCAVHDVYRALTLRRMRAETAATSYRKDPATRSHVWRNDPNRPRHLVEPPKKIHGIEDWSRPIRCGTPNAESSWMSYRAFERGAHFSDAR